MAQVLVLKFSVAHGAPLNHTQNRFSGIFLGDWGGSQPSGMPCTGQFAVKWVVCPDGTKWAGESGVCVQIIDRYRESKQQCSGAVGNPIYPLIGSKRQPEELGRWLAGGEPVGLTYDSRRKVPANDSAMLFSVSPSPSFGELWGSTLHKQLVRQAGVGVSASPAIQASRGGGAWISFIRNSAGVYVAADASIQDRVVAITTGWRYLDAASQAVEIYDVRGLLTSVSHANGATLNYTYSTAVSSTAPQVGLLMKVQDQFGRSVQFEYEASSGTPRISRAIDPSGTAVVSSYDASGNLSKITWQDTRWRQFLYERSDLPWALTGINDERQLRYATFGYDVQGRANATEHAGGADRYSVSYAAPPSWNIVESYDSAAGVFWRDHYATLPTGTQLSTPQGYTGSVGAALVNGLPMMTTQSQPAGSGCEASSSSLEYDGNGNVSRRDDFNGKRQCYSHDLGRNLEAIRVEGLEQTAQCSMLVVANAALPSGSRKVTTQWHPEWKLKTRQAEPNKLTTWVYNGQPDPFNAGAVASCAPASAVLPDGKPIVVLCRQVEQETTDASGSLGFAAALPARAATQEQKWSYNGFGQMLTHDGPRTDVADITTYTYYSDTTADHTLGDLQSVTNALGKVTRYTQYNKHGQVLSMVDANGVVTAYTYDLRQRLKSVAVGGQLTQYDYDLAGQLKKVTQPDGSTVGYDYDDAHRLTAVYDNLGNRIDYVLDNAGNRKEEKVTDPGGTLKRKLARVIDALGRVQQTTSGE